MRGGSLGVSKFVLRSHPIDERLLAPAEGAVTSALGERVAQAVKVFEELYEFFGESGRRRINWVLQVAGNWEQEVRVGARVGRAAA